MGNSWTLVPFSQSNGLSLSFSFYLTTLNLITLALHACVPSLVPSTIPSFLPGAPLVLRGAVRRPEAAGRWAALTGRHDGRGFDSSRTAARRVRPVALEDLMKTLAASWIGGEFGSLVAVCRRSLNLHVTLTATSSCRMQKLYCAHALTYSTAQTPQ